VSARRAVLVEPSSARGAEQRPAEALGELLRGLPGERACGAKVEPRRCSEASGFELQARAHLTYASLQIAVFEASRELLRPAQACLGALDVVLVLGVERE
jgi:hypothetical protein